ncbi:MAG: peptide chain release factor N(5)-glutamine methyltransferase [Anaerolineae bacterium]|nr:peptide chain release factor N(5)-glutamine methyltransferase [Anaerolineae bacterium]
MIAPYTVRDALLFGRANLANTYDSASLDIQRLLGFVLDKDRAYLLAHPEHILETEEYVAYIALIERAAAGEPLPYILGRQAFYDRDLIVSPAVLIPRPETEQLVENALGFARSRPRCTAVDVGTGSGAIAVTVAANCPTAAVYAVDVSPAALDIARQNAEAGGAKVTFFQGDLLVPLLERDIKVDLLMANLPYIARAELADLVVSRYEPSLALDGGEDGFDLVRRLLDQAPAVCNPGARILLEIGADQGAAALALAKSVFPDAAATLIQDYAKLDRIIQIDVAGK